MNSGVLLVVIMLVFGSAATFFFWAKWLAKILGSMRDADDVERSVHASEWVSLGTMAVLVVLCAVLLPAISAGVVSPYASQLVGGVLAEPSGADLVVMAVMALVMVVLPVIYALRGKTLSANQVEHQPYMAAWAWATPPSPGRSAPRLPTSSATGTWRASSTSAGSGWSAPWCARCSPASWWPARWA